MRLILAEDSALLRSSLAALLKEEGHEVLAEVEDGETLIEAVAEHRPDVVVADVRMPPTHTNEGLRAALEIRKRWPEVGVLVLSQYIEKRYTRELLAVESQGVGYLLKDRVVDVDEFVDALERVASGRSAFDEEVVRQIVARSEHTDILSRLTSRESDVLAEMAQGHSNPAIAKKLSISQSGVEKHINSIFDKLELARNTEHSRRVLAVLRYLGT